jgi:hypothetical protein
MASATLKRLCRQALLEYIQPFERQPSSGKRVDWDRGIIFGAKILGLKSLNDQGKRFYTRPVLQRAQPLYEGAPLYANHPKDPKELRDVREQIGTVRNVRVLDDGMYGDLHLLTTKDFSRTLMEAAEKQPQAFKLSHNADGDKEFHADGSVEISEITEVRSVDVVSRGATNATLFESPIPEKTMYTYANLLDWLSRHEKVTRKQRKSLLEAPEDMPGMDVPVPEPEGEKEPHEHLEDGVRAAAVACLEKYFAGEESKEECLKKLKELLGSHASFAGGGEKEAPVEESKEEFPKTSGKSKEVDESAPASKGGKYILTEGAARSLMTLAGFDLSKSQPLLESITGLDNEKAMGILNTCKTSILESAPKHPQGPRSAPSYRPKQETKSAGSTEEFVSELKSGQYN